MATCTGPLPQNTTDGQLTINGVDLVGPAWDVVNLRKLWTVTATRGSNVLIPTVQGKKARRLRVDEVNHTLDMVIIGEYDRLSSENADPVVGLEANINYLRANVTDPTGTGDGTLAATLTMPSGATRTADIQVNSFTIGEGLDSMCLATLDITVPSGAFV